MCHDIPRDISSQNVPEYMVRYLLGRQSPIISTFPDVDTPGNHFLNAYIKDLTGWEGSFNFDDSTIDFLDRRLAERFTKRQFFRIYRLLNLSLPAQSIVDAEMN